MVLQEGDVRVVVLGQLELPEPDGVEPGSRVCLDLLDERCPGRGDLGQRENHERPGTLASSRRAIGGLVSAFATR